MSADFLLELRCEEIPARMQAKASEDMARLFSERLAEAGLKAESLTSYVTPRRLALIAHGLPLHTQAVSEEFKGPRTTAPEQALEGFLRKTGLAKDQLEDRDGVWFAVVEKPGRATADVLAEAIPAIIRAFPWPKSMRWGVASQTTESLRWVRPLQGIVAILGEQLVEMEVDGIRSGYATAGHRFHHAGEITIGGAADYVEKLRACHVIVDQDERKALIESRAKALAADASYELIEDAGLVAENAGLTEWPVPLLGHFDPDFLEVPSEVIQLTLRINQKYFVLRDKAGQLAPAFICTANIDAKDGGAAIVAGNGKVLTARLSDARFFWEQDKKTKLADHAKKLSRITFHEKLGTVADKVERVAKLAEWLANEGIVPNCDPALARQAAELCKADLVTEMVGEFPELQGLMGGYYALEEHLDSDVADALTNQYKTVGPEGNFSGRPLAVILSLADKLDTLVCFFAVDERPTGSKDPYALRRAALGVASLITQYNLRFSLWGLLFALAFDFYAKQRSPVRLRVVTNEFNKLTAWSQPNFNNGSNSEQLMHALNGIIEPQYHSELNRALSITVELFNFFVDRLKVQQKEIGVRHDLIDAVFALGVEDDLVLLLDRVRALQSFIETPDGTNLLAGYRRAANILKKEKVEVGIHPSYGFEPAEVSLMKDLALAEAKAVEFLEKEDYERVMAALASLRAPIDAFFESVIVNDPEPAKRAARLALLERVRTAVHKVADFSKISG
jgi:glycyl-tRNA synthetase beta chain